jgi:hypothetical protein
VSPKVKERLDVLRRELGVRSWDSFLTLLANEFRKQVEEGRRARVRKEVCNELGEARASLAGWVKKLQSVLESEKEVVIALEYLRRDPQDPEMLVVDKEKCVKGWASVGRVAGTAHRLSGCDAVVEGVVEDGGWPALKISLTTELGYVNVVTIAFRSCF